MEIDIVVAEKDNDAGREVSGFGGRVGKRRWWGFGQEH